MPAATAILLLLFHSLLLHPGWCFRHPSTGASSTVTVSFPAKSLRPLCSSTSTSIETILNDITQTDADLQLHQTLQQLGVRGIGTGIGIRVCTTSQSVAGRGAFWSPTSIGADKKDEAAVVQRGDVLAYIPKTSILTLSNPALIASSHDNYEEEEDQKEKALQMMKEFTLLSAKSSWPVVFTLYVHAVSRQNEAFHEWIESFIGPDPPICPPPNKENENAGDDDAASSSSTINKEQEEQTIIYNEAIQNLVSMAQVPEETAKEATAARYGSYKRDWNAAREWMADATCNISSIHMEEGTFAKLYSILISRTANLGPTYQRESESKEASSMVRGVIPLHDMINHPPFGTEHNVELLSVGDLRTMLSEEKVHQLLDKILRNIGKNALELDDKDVLLIARCEILPGDELFLSYRNNNRGSKPMEEKERAWTTLQYGFLIQ
mmetsp:Transcript_23108/g.48747  ORF Transcript_23108/g.48747 Transcript_23108/m.48747 type:complete len:437 (+) Transcript_23108:13-1323(+)